MLGGQDFLLWRNVTEWPERGEPWRQITDSACRPFLAYEDRQSDVSTSASPELGGALIFMTLERAQHKHCALRWPQGRGKGLKIKLKMHQKTKIKQGIKKK